jgi:hypothetical protein
MKKITIPNTKLTVSKFIFGTGSLIKNIREKKQLHILNKAIEYGFTHFDTAPLYGFGSTEKLVGSIIKNNHQLSVTAKVGLYPPYGLNPNVLKISCIRAFYKIIRTLNFNFNTAVVNFEIKKAKISLENTLKNLRRDCIDIYMLHEPIYKLFFCDEWRTFFENLKKEGKIKYSGLGSDTKHLVDFIKNKKIKLFDILQVNDSIDRQEANILIKNQLPLQITYGYFSSAKKRNIDHLNILSGIKIRNELGAIIVSSNDCKNIKELSLI